MTNSTPTKSATGPSDIQSIGGAPGTASPRGPNLLSKIAHALSPTRVSALYVSIFALVVFAFWIPNLFYTETTLKSILYQQAVTAIVALAFLIPYTTHNFDLTVGVMVGVSALTSTWLMTNGGLPWPAAIVVALLFCAVIGMLNGVLVTVIRIESVIATIATMSMIEALGTAAFEGKQVFGLPTGFLSLAQTEVFGISIVFFYLIAIAIVLWYILRHTPLGRYLYAIGGNTEAARLAGVRVQRLVFSSFVASAVLAGIAGVLVASRVGTGDFAVGQSYLFPAAAAMFFGSTQVKPGTYNVWGTLLAVYTLAIVVKGLELGGAPFWVTEVANGVALLIAVGIQAVRQTRNGGGPARWLASKLGSRSAAG
ncbi:ABC transporter permease [Rhodococcus globerulus]|uniref:ABC transporter permease n=1 Tax=Rhodococcus globerulus TaxID=33008 RepID=A0ABU4C3Q9_RHOGO|nr:ABC transporter permease [Rhodococcus globerulus]MDV6271138.1 ABC transporter permease [Rhodococcus globerulus]